MRHLFFLPFICFSVFSGALSAQIKFRKAPDLLEPALHYSGVPISVCDMDGDGHDDLVRMDRGNLLAIQYQTAPNRPFALRHTATVDILPQWGICVADLNNDGPADVLTAGYYDGVKTFFSSGNSYLLDELSLPPIFVQGANFMDINNDGWLDAFLCNDDSTSFILGNDGTGILEYHPEWINLNTVPKSDNSGNYGSVWSDVDGNGYPDLYISKCRQNVTDATDPRRINQLFLNNGDGTYTQDTLNITGLRIGAQSWSTDFGDIDNDGDMDCFLTNHDISSQLLENDGAGHFTDITAQAGLFDQVAGIPTQGIFRDFDNDGFLDILVAGDRHFIFRNNGNKTFTALPNPFGKKQMESFAVGDLNSDGFVDIYGGYAKLFNDPVGSIVPDALWINEGNSNHYIGLNLRGIQSNRSAVGARVLLYHALGVQVREVRAGESYGISNSLQVLFGLGQTTQVDSIVVRWPSGARDVLPQPSIDQYLTIFEKKCVVKAVLLSANGPTTFCKGGQVTLTAPSGFSKYLWNTGNTSPNHPVSASGFYAVQVTTAEGCTVSSNIVEVTVQPDETPLISVAGPASFCEGDSILLTASPAASYLWNNGQKTPSIWVTKSGDYTVTTQGLCESFSSSPQTMTMLAAPAPLLTNDTVTVNNPATLKASGSMPRWYDSPSSPTPFFTGNQWITPPLSASDTFWVDNLQVYDQPNQFTGMINHAGTSFGDVQYNGGIIFDCYQPFVLARTRVYTTTAGDRRIILLDETGKELQSKTVNIGTGTSTLDLGFEVPVGTELMLTTDSTVNLQSFGTLGPRLRRSDNNVKYPYEIPGVVSLLTSSFDGTRYYYFFNWEVDFYSTDCASERLPVLAIVADSMSNIPSEPDWAHSLTLFPNPTTGILTTEIAHTALGELEVSLLNTQGAVLQTQRPLASTNLGKARFQTDLSQLPKGIYWLELTNAQGVVRRKIIHH